MNKILLSGSLILIALSNPICTCLGQTGAAAASSTNVSAPAKPTLPNPLPGSPAAGIPPASLTLPSEAANLQVPDATGGVLNPAAPPPPPLMGTITQEVAVTINQQEVRRGPFTGLVVHVKNGTNSPFIFDGDHAFITINGNKIDPITDADLELMVARPTSHWEEAKLGLLAFATVGVAPTIKDELRSRGPVLPRYGADQMRREATGERFAMRILWPGEDTQGIIFFKTSQHLSGGQLQLPVVTFPTMEVRGYVSPAR